MPGSAWRSCPNTHINNNTLTELCDVTIVDINDQLKSVGDSKQNRIDAMVLYHRLVKHCSVHDR